MKYNELDHIWSVFVGGTEVNDYYLTLSSARQLAQDYINDDYDQVVLLDTDGNEIVVKE